MKFKGQNLIEFIIVIPLLILIVFGIIEISLFWKNAQTVQEIALQSAAAAATVYVKDANNSSDPTDANFNPAVKKAAEVVQKRLGSLGINGITLNYNDLGDAYGVKPYSLYEFVSTQTRDTDLGPVPLIRFTVDYRDPSKNGINTQLIYQYRTVLLGMEFVLPGGRKVTIIPKDIEISSTKIQQYNGF